MRALLLLLLLTACCGTAQPRPEAITEDSYPWQWRDVSELPGDFLWQQSIDAKFGSKTFHLEAVLQKKDGVITLIGMTPFGSKAFALTQRGTDVTFESFVDRAPPFPPKFMLIDVQRAYFPFAAAPDQSAEASTLASEHGGETVSESFRVGLLESRTYQRPDKQGAIAVRYEHWQDGVPRDVHVDNAWFGYTMHIRTTSAQRL